MSSLRHAYAQRVLDCHASGHPIRLIVTLDPTTPPLDAPTQRHLDERHLRQIRDALPGVWFYRPTTDSVSGATSQADAGVYDFYPVDQEHALAEAQRLLTPPPSLYESIERLRAWYDGPDHSDPPLAEILNVLTAYDAETIRSGMTCTSCGDAIALVPERLLCTACDAEKDGR